MDQSYNKEPAKQKSYFDDKEDQYAPALEAWRADQTPKGNAALIKAITPEIETGLKTYAANNPLAKAQAKVLAIHAARTYDPAKSRFASHLHNNLKALQRISRQQSEVIKVPERILLEQRALKSNIGELRDQLGREPSDVEISDAMGLPLSRLAKIRSYKAGLNTGRVSNEESDESSADPAVRKFGMQEAKKYWVEMVYEDLQPTDQRIMELSLGLNGQRKLSNQEIAARLKVSPTAITQRKAKIQAKLDREQELSPFLG
jgi:DNA-directed RNA polymerase specialized sigma subunit